MVYGRNIFLGWVSQVEHMQQKAMDVNRPKQSSLRLRGTRLRASVFCRTDVRPTCTFFFIHFAPRSGKMTDDP